eukprot:CAMPEP_0204343322 /NCGR_PEP_ID=MMETSP0469-20131031/24823_1 /ASSEMBLY_ACC=CAM_ASM_000384 /TAXON_ID=2969 /ORGANISM="Oxyrrhis marina" /LENGTH=133 /DNA_ID=CAMNT_0051328401 /DNA_START=1 /DNA_END=399 /DNA_ORIENTATION=-
MRAVEVIVKQPGLTLPKVMVLIGGPDWPTSVTTGILRCSLAEMLLGTLPVIFLVTPCILAGAFTLKASEPGAWSTVSTITLSAATTLQGCAMMLAGYYIQSVVSERYEELSQSRPEHKLLEEDAKRQEIANEE